MSDLGSAPPLESAEDARMARHLGKASAAAAHMGRYGNRSLRLPDGIPDGWVVSFEGGDWVLARREETQ